MNGKGYARRTVLRRGGLATGAVVVGGITAGTVTGHGARGGSGFVIDHPDQSISDYRDIAGGTPFRVVHPVEEGNSHWLLETSPSCNGRAPRKTYRGYRFETDGGKRGNLYLNPEREVSAHGEHWYELTSAHECGGGTTQDSDTDWDTVWKVAYKQVTP